MDSGEEKLGRGIADKEAILTGLRKLFEDSDSRLKETMEFVEMASRDASIMDAEEFYERILYLKRYLSEGVEVLKEHVEAADAKLDEMHEFIQLIANRK